MGKRDRRILVDMYMFSNLSNYLYRSYYACLAVLLVLFYISHPGHSVSDAVSDVAISLLGKQQLSFVQVYLDDCPLHLKVHLWQVSRLNDRVILVGHFTCARFCERWGIEFYNADDFRTTAIEFDRDYFPRDDDYRVQWEPNRRAFEVHCFERWFILEEFMRRQWIERVFYADADTMIYANLNEIDEEFFLDKEWAIMWQPPSITISFAIVSRRGARDFIHFVKELYLHWPDVFPYKKGKVPVHTIMNDMYAMRLYIVSATPPEQIICADLNLPPNHPVCNEKVSLKSALLAPYKPKVAIGSLAQMWSFSEMHFDNNLSDDRYHQFDTFEVAAESAITLGFTQIKRVTWLDGIPHMKMNVTRSDEPLQTIKAVGLHFHFKKKLLMEFFMRDYRDRSCARPLACTCVSVTCQECLTQCDRNSRDAFLRKELLADDAEVSFIYSRKRPAW
eukprot:CAMPEP_0184649942 /NCGR_PEP_ID=MMETSP0308-20130426/7409_1 /TAXON_ID=38269 /ORGANISM="Gloeochaete witrockiana, Strain SAG 46.84" /LENGTH=447 /DNA_ID=CAMNT_0027083095 /DNA_START=147 /DNA_END=1487 /DNA_ORIENTATION=+